MVPIEEGVAHSGTFELNSASRGLLVAIDGLDGVGKSTLAQRASDVLDGVVMRPMSHACHLMEAELIASGATIHEVHAFSVRAHAEREHEIFATLRVGKTVILDRWFYSSIAYYYALCRLAKQPCNAVAVGHGFVMPDLAVWLDHKSESDVKSRILNRGANAMDLLTINRPDFRAYLSAVFCRFADDQMLARLYAEDALEKISKLATSCRRPLSIARVNETHYLY